MVLSRRFDPYLKGSPITVMVRAISERALGAEALDALFEGTAERQYTRQLMFSTVVGLMSEVVLGITPSQTRGVAIRPGPSASMSRRASLLSCSESRPRYLYRSPQIRRLPRYIRNYTAGN